MRGPGDNTVGKVLALKTGGPVFKSQHPGEKVGMYWYAAREVDTGL